MKKRLQFVVAMTIAACLATSLNAADFAVRTLSAEEQARAQRTLVPTQTEILLSGPIVAEDTERLRDLTDGLMTFGGASRLRLNSPGGSFREAMTLSNLVRDLGLITYVGAGDECLSACALVFMSGTEGGGDGSHMINRIMNHQATIGFHAPFTLNRDLEIPAEARALLMIDAERNAMEAGSALVRMAVDGRMPTHLVEALMLVDQTEFLRADTVDRAGLWAIEIENALPMRTLDHERLESYCSNVFAWEQALMVEDRENFFPVVLMSVQNGALLTTPMMEFACDLRMSDRGNFGFSVVGDENRLTWVRAWQTLPAETLLSSLGPEEILDGAGPNWDVRLRPAGLAENAPDYEALRNVRGVCRDSTVWNAGWSGPVEQYSAGEQNSLPGFAQATESHAALNDCAGGLGPFGITCIHGKGRYLLRFADMILRDRNATGTVSIEVGRAAFDFFGEYYDLFGHAMFRAFIQPDHPLIEALKRGAQFTIIEGGSRRTYHLSGSAQAIEAMELTCR